MRPTPAASSSAASRGTPSLSEKNTRKLELSGLAAILIGFLLLVSLYFSVGTYGGVDEAAYLLTGRQLARTGSPLYYNNNPLQNTSEDMIETAPGVFAAKYPIGYPLLLAAAYRIGGLIGPFAVNPLCGLLFLCAVYALFRYFLLAPWALLATTMLAFHPIIVLYSVGALSHIADIAAATAALAVALRWSRAGGFWRAGLAGLFLGIACCIRATDILLLLPIGLLAARRWSLPPQRPLPKLAEGAALLAALFAGLLPALYFQWVEFGSPFLTGYRFTHEDTAFSLAHLLHHLAPLLWSFNTWGEGLPVVFPIALIALGYLAFRQRFVGAFLLLWILPIAALYCAYYWITREFPYLYLRFYLILYPALLLALCLFLQTLLAKRRLAQGSAIALLLVLTASGWLSGGIRRALDSAEITGTGSAGAAGMILNLHQPDAAILCDLHFALFQVYATDNPIYSADWFTTGWTRKNLSAIGSPGVLPINDFRAKQLAAALKRPNDQQTLDSVLVAEMQRQLDAHHPVYLLTMPGKLPAWVRLFPGRIVVPPNARDPLQFELFPILPEPP